MVIPWVGFPLADFIKKCEPTSKAKFVEFTTLVRSEADAGHALPTCSSWPYVEGLRMDEAMHPLTILAVGLYGEVLPNQNGAPLRLVVPWKYGFKRVKSIVKIRFVEKQPMNTWQLSGLERVRLLRQREPDRRSSALEPGDRARASASFFRKQDADVQRLRRSGGESVRGHGSQEELLIDHERRRVRRSGLDVKARRKRR